MKHRLVLAAMLALTLMAVTASAQMPMPEILLDNPSVRVTVVTFVPGAGTGRHQGIEPEVGIVVDGQLTVDSPHGRWVLRPGSAYFIPGLTPHDARNGGAAPARLFEVFLKRCD